MPRRAGSIPWQTIPSIVIPAGLTVLLFVLTLFLFAIPTLHSQLMQRKRDMIRELTRTAWGVVANYERDERAGRLSRDEAQRRAVAHLRTLRYGPDNRDYFWIATLDGFGVLHPYTPEIEGKDLRDVPDAHGTNLYLRIVGVTSREGGGFVEYDWQWQDDPSRIAPKISYVKAFEPWGWVIGTGMYLDNVRTEIAANTRQLTWISIGILAIVSGLSGIIIRKDLRIEARRRRAERLLRELNAELEARVSRRTSQLRETNALIRQQNEVLARTVSELQERERVMSDELQLAQEVQLEFLPKSFPFTDELRFAALYQSSQVVGGDLYDAFRVNDRTAGFYIADASGHGVSAALVIATVKVAFDRFRYSVNGNGEAGVDINGGMFSFDNSQSLAAFMEALNNALVDAIPLYSFVTFLLGVFHLDTGRLLLANAGHHAPLCYRVATRGVEELLVPSNLPLGAVPNCLFQIREHRIEPGDRIIIHTDGITECSNDQREEFGLHNLIRTIQQHGHETAELLLHEIKQHTTRFSGRPDPADDQAVLVIDFRPHGPPPRATSGDPA